VRFSNFGLGGRWRCTVEKIKMVRETEIVDLGRRRFLKADGDKDKPVEINNVY
jgi:hypothetical protein